jgi:hypothetical protein
MDAEMIARAQYDSKTARAQDTLSSKYLFTNPIVEVDGEYFHQLTINRLADGATVHQANYGSVEELDDAIAGWTATLGISNMCTAMMGL